MKSYYQNEFVTLFHDDNRNHIPQPGQYDCFCSDPPYGINAARHRRSQKDGWVDYGTVEEGKWDTDTPKQDTLDALRVGGKIQIIWGGNYFQLPPSMGWLCWDKGQRDFSLSDGELAWTNQNKALRIFSYSRASATRSDKKVHPTQKPTELLIWCLKWAGDIKTVFDPYAGSGSTGEACIRMGIKCVLIEREERLCNEIALRMASALRSEKSCLLSISTTKKMIGFGV